MLITWCCVEKSNHPITANIIGFKYKLSSYTSDLEVIYMLPYGLIKWKSRLVNLHRSM